MLDIETFDNLIEIPPLFQNLEVLINNKPWYLEINAENQVIGFEIEDHYGVITDYKSYMKNIADYFKDYGFNIKEYYYSYIPCKDYNYYELMLELTTVNQILINFVNRFPFIFKHIRYHIRHY